MAAAVRQAAKVAPWKQALARWAYAHSTFNQLGLMRDDTLNETPDVKEALRRLPAHVQDERMFRISRALQLSNCKTTLPKEEWTKYDDDVLYLQPYLEEVKREMAEKAEWSKR